jgi:DNA-binding transcriptional LysR family regulator
MGAPRVSLEQWRTLQAVIDQGGYARAAEHLHRSQSSVSYTLAKLQEQLGMRLLYIDGRKARLTAAGEVLVRRSRSLVQDAARLEELARTLDQGWEPEVRLVVDAAFPTRLLMTALKRFAPLSRGTRVQLTEVVLSGAHEALTAGEAELGISAELPADRLGDRLIDIEFAAVAHPEHALHRLGRTLTGSDLSREIQVVIRASGPDPRNKGWLAAEHRWTVTSIDSALSAISQGLGFGWLPCHMIEDRLAAGTLCPLPLREGQRYKVGLYLTYGHEDRIGPATRQLAEILHSTTRELGG